MIINKRTDYKLRNMYEVKTLFQMLNIIDIHNYTALVMTKDVYDALLQVCHRYSMTNIRTIPFEVLYGLRIYISDNYCKLIGRDCMIINAEMEEIIIEYLKRENKEC